MIRARSPRDPGKNDKGLVSVVIPCFNEQANIADCVEAVRCTLRRRPDPFEIIAVNDGSVDETLSVLQSLAGE